jgi:folate-binding protein YgfZ
MLNPTLMPYKTNPPPSSLPQLSGFSMLAFEGADAASFLQAQTMNDVGALRLEHWQWNAWLNSKGRVIALFALFRSADTAFIAILPDFSATELLPQLQRFVFRSKVRLRVVEDFVCAGQFSPCPTFPEIAPDRVFGEPASGWALDFSGQGGDRRLWLLPQPVAAITAASQAETDARWLLEDLAHGLPRLPAEQRETWTPQMLSLQRLNAFSLRKGCYPGQEIVARTHYLGQAKRGLMRLQGANIVAAATVSDETGTSIGQVVCASYDGSQALAVVQLDPPRPSVWIEGREAGLSAPLTGLQRPQTERPA